MSLSSSSMAKAPEASPAVMSAICQTPVVVHGGIDGALVNHDQVAEEVPVALVYNGISHAVMMASPCDLDDFALGFSLTEGILEHPEQLFATEAVASEQGIALELQIHGECLARLKQQRRTMAGRTGCGLCGTESLAHAVRPIPRVPGHKAPGDAAVQTALQGLRQNQPLQAETGATHGAAWCDLEGQVLMLREDVGRHNALDKLIGARIAALGAAAFEDGFVLISSRASFEMVQKSASVGIGCLVAVSAATALAVRQARAAGLTLIGFARAGRHVVYTPQESPGV